MPIKWQKQQAHDNSNLYVIRKQKEKCVPTKTNQTTLSFMGHLSFPLSLLILLQYIHHKEENTGRTRNADLSQATSRASFSKCQAICLKAQVTSQEMAKKQGKKEEALIKIHRICSATEMDGD